MGIGDKTVKNWVDILEMKLRWQLEYYMKINTMNKLDESLILGMLVETTGGQIHQNITSGMDPDCRTTFTCIEQGK
jgi:hypothetical protein